MSDSPLPSGSRTFGRTRRAVLAVPALAVLLLSSPLPAWLAGVSARAGEAAVLVPPPAFDAPKAGHSARETAVLAGGCFWGVQAVFQHVKGVDAAVSGYAGGAKNAASYDAVSGGATGHAEAVEITFDPDVVSYGELLRIYFSVAHDPTQRDRQGPDIGPQYRSAVFPRGEEQAAIASRYIEQLDRAGVFASPLATRIEAGRDFYPAEGYHQDYLVRHPTSPYIVVHDLPKIENLKRLFPQSYRAEPKLVGRARS